MANTFKNASLASVNHSAFATLYTCPSATTAIILGLAITNKTDNSVTASVQFTDTSDSSATRLLLNEVTIPAKKGNVVVFHNALESISTTHPKVNPQSLHAGMPVIKGEKWMTNLWFREKLRY